MSIAEIKERLLAGRKSIEEAHRQIANPPTSVSVLPGTAIAQAPARRIATALTDLSDWVVGQVYRPALEELPPESRSLVSAQLSLVAIGGYGRAALAPYSDIDLLFLATPDGADTPLVREFVSRLVRDLWDAGLQLSHSVRTIPDCISAARGDLAVRTALPEARLLIGEADQAAELRRRMQRLFASVPVNKLIAEILSERVREHQDYHAQTVLLLEPNVKKSPGGLRDIHMLRWISLGRYRTQDLERLEAEGALSKEDATVLAEGQEFLQHIRHELHFHAGLAQDVLTRDEQVRIASWLGFTDEGGLLGVERFMRHYYRQTAAIHDVVMRFVERARTKSALGKLVSHVAASRVEQDFLLSRTSLTIAPDRMEPVLKSAERILHLLDCARGYGVKVDHATMERIRETAGGLEITPQARRRFLALLDHPPGLDHLLGNLNKAGLLGRLLPPFEHARGLIQFNLYHKYTVDEHTLRAVAAAARRREDRGSIGQAYREVHRKDLLHLAILLHDLGKGYDRDHSLIGREFAETTAGEFGLNEHERRLLTFLVHQHLLMSETAFRRDLADEATVVQFSRAVATPEALNMLFVLTAADIEAVSPGNWTAWKQMLLDELYVRAAEALTGEAPLGDQAVRAERARLNLAKTLNGQFSTEWLNQQLELMPLSYLQTTDPPKIARDMQVLRNMPDPPVKVVAEYQSATNSVEYTIFTSDDLTDGIFSKIAGVLAAGGIQIVSARIVTRPDNLVVDTFVGQDLTFAGEPPAHRLDEVSRQIESVLLGKLPMEELLARRRLPVGGNGHGTAVLAAPPQVEIDNETSSRYTIVEVFAQDRLGRLYTITRTLYELGLSVHSAKISTHADQIIDAFYVTTRTGEKVTDPRYLEKARLQVLHAIENA